MNAVLVRPSTVSLKPLLSKSVAAKPASRLNVVKTIAGYKPKIQIDKIHVPIETTHITLKPTLLNRIRTNPTKKSLSLLTGLEADLQKYKDLEAIHLRSKALLKLLTTDDKFKFGYDSDKVKLADKVHDTGKAMKAIMDGEAFKKSVVTGKKAEKIVKETETVREGLEKLVESVDASNNHIDW